MNIQTSMLRFGAPLTGIGRWSGFSRFFLVGLLLLSGWTFAQAAAFTTSTTSGEAPLEVVFTDRSEEPADHTRSWSFGDGGSGTGLSPTHSYLNPGVFEVVLTVTGPVGEPSTARATITVTEPEPLPVAGFTADPASGTAPLNVSFTNTSTGKIDSYAWDFGDGNVSSDESPTHEYTTPGEYTVSLTVEGPGGTDTITGTVTVLWAAPIASFTSDVTSGPAPLDVSFTDTSTGQINSWYWDFGDGSTSSSQSPQHTYEKPGNYSVVLKVSGNGGTSESTSTIKALASATLAWQAVPDTRVAGYEVHYGTASQTYDSVVSTSTNSATVPGLEFGQTYYFAIKSRGSTGLLSEFSDEVSATIGVAAPQAAFSSSVTQGVAPLRVQFTDQSTGQVSAWHWAFGYGASSTVRSPEHVYQSPGEYKVVLSVKGQGGANVSRETTIKVLAPPPIAKIRQSTKTGISPLAVTFVDASTWPVGSRLWDFGDGNTSTVAAPTHVYEVPGQYTTVLKVQGQGGSSQASVGTTVLWPPPIADFTQSATSGEAPVALTFTDTSIGNVASYSWNFGDGTTSTARNPIHTYNKGGVYKVVLTVKGPGGTSSKTGVSTTITWPPPVASFTQSPTSGIAPLTVAFKDTSTSLGPISAYRWEFGDGGTSTAQSPTYVYKTPGTYAAVLSVTGPGGHVSESTGVPTTVLTPPPVANFTQDVTTGPAPLTVKFTNASTGGPVTSYVWTFGDGATSTDASPTHVFTKPGPYTVVLAVTGPGGTSSKTGVTTTVKEPPPVANFTQDLTTGPAPLTVKFTNASTGGPVTSYLWTFGDGATSTDASPTHVFTKPGSYNVRLDVKGPGGESSKTGVTTTVTEPPPVADFTQDVTTGPAPLTVKFANTSTGGPVTSYLWTFGDGATSTEESPTHVFTKPGPYTVELTVTGPGGNSSKTGETTTVTEPAAPVASFDHTPASGNAPLDVVFSDTSTGNINSWSWNFGDGQKSTLQSPEHTYSAAGTYSVTLTVTGYGGTSTKTAVIEVLNPVLEASFTEDKTTGKAPLTVAFKSTSTGTIDSYEWSFGDGGTSSAKEALHTYTNAGTYSVSLKVTGEGQSDTETKKDLITVEDAEPPPVADFSADTLVGDAPLTVTFKDLTTGNAAQRAWEFGDQGTSDLSNPVHIYANPGTYTVRLTATGPGGSNVMEKKAFITVRAPTGGSGVLAVESGTLSVDSNWTSVAFKKPFTDPIVVASAMSFNNAEPAVVRIDGITKDGFRIRVQEWDYLDKVHPAETVHFLVVERGRHQLPSGTWIEAGRMSASGGSSWNLQSFASPFASVPVMFTAVVSNGNETAVTTRLRAIKTGSFQVRLQKQENIVNTHGSESVNWIAWQASSGTLDGLKFRVARTSTKVTHLPFALSFKAGLAGTPMFLAAIQTVTSLDTAALRWSGLTANGVKVWVQEEQSLDAEVAHSGESIGWAVFQGTSTAPTPPVADFSADKVVGDAPLSIRFQNKTTGNATQLAWAFGDGATSSESNPVHSYTNPGTYTVQLTASGPGGSNVMQKVGFITVRQPSGGPGGLVVESGTLSVDNNWQWVAFKKTFTDPIVVAGGLSYKDVQPAVVRLDRIDETGFWVRVKEWDYLDGSHAAETVSFLVVERGRHQLPSGAWIEAGQMNASGGSSWNLQSFKSPFGVMPVLFTSIASANDPTAVTTRLRQIQTGRFELRLQKQESIMNRHGSESVNWIAWQPSSGTVDGLKFRVGKTASKVTNLPFALSFKAGLSAAPVFLSSIQTVRSMDTVVLRWSDLNANGVKAWVQEEQSLDAEVTHIGESMGWAVFE